MSLWSQAVCRVYFQVVERDLSKVEGFGLYRAQEFRTPNQGRLFRMRNGISGGCRQ